MKTNITSKMVGLFLLAHAFQSFGQNPLSFTGDCKLSGHGHPEEVVGTFNVKAEKPGLESQLLTFTAPSLDESTEYSVVAEFFRPTNREDLVNLRMGWRPIVGGIPGGPFGGLRSIIFSEAEGNAGRTLYLRYEPKTGVSIICSGTVQ